jgi:hypothetical protein
MRKYIVVFLFLPVFGMGQTLIDSYAESNYSLLRPMYNGYIFSHTMQSFSNTNSITLTTAKGKFNKAGSPTGSMYVKIYDHTGTYGTSSLPTGSVLATSDALDVSTLTSTETLKTFNFSGANQITLTANTKYVIIFEYTGGNSSNCPYICTDNTSPTHEGNAGYSAAGTTYTVYTATDIIFYVYGDAAAAPTASPFQTVFY